MASDTSVDCSFIVVSSACMCSLHSLIRDDSHYRDRVTVITVDDLKGACIIIILYREISL
jgi:hypothetical protein